MTELKTAKQIQFTYKGREYTLEYTRKTVEMMERQGFVAEKAMETPNISVRVLFAGAFKAHHPTVRTEVIEDIFAHMPKEDLIVKLVEMYQEPFATLMADPPEGDEGNVSWTTNW